MPKLSDEHYLRAVTELGDSRKIVANCDIYSQNGMKLVAAGVHISSALYERLVMHKLLPSLEKALSVENPLDSKIILEDVHDLLRTNEKLGRMSEVIGRSVFHRQILSIRFPSPLSFKLTVAREKYPNIYQHSLLLMVIGIYLAHCDGRDLHEQKWVSIAALFHDIGLLHIDPKLLAPSHVMSNSERRQLYAHPLTAYLLLSEFPEIPRYIADAVLEHHERMDGSGYPRGLRGDKITRYGQILAVAELAAKACDSNHKKVPWAQLEVMLKLSSRQYGKGLIGHLNIFWKNETTDVSSSINEMTHPAAQVMLIAKIFEDFNNHSDPKRRDKIFDLAQARLAALRLELFDAGFDPREPANLIQRFIDDSECISEYVPLLTETLWQFNALVLEISRRWADESGDNELLTELSERVWLNDMKRSLHTSALSD